MQTNTKPRIPTEKRELRLNVMALKTFYSYGCIIKQYNMQRRNIFWSKKVPKKDAKRQRSTVKKFQSNFRRMTPELLLIAVEMELRMRVNLEGGFSSAGSSSPYLILNWFIRYSSSFSSSFCFLERQSASSNPILKYIRVQTEVRPSWIKSSMVRTGAAYLDERN